MAGRARGGLRSATGHTVSSGTALRSATGHTMSSGTAQDHRAAAGRQAQGGGACRLGAAARTTLVIHRAGSLGGCRTASARRRSSRARGCCKRRPRRQRACATRTCSPSCRRASAPPPRSASPSRSSRSAWPPARAEGARSGTTSTLGVAMFYPKERLASTRPEGAIGVLNTRARHGHAPASKAPDPWRTERVGDVLKCLGRPVLW